MRRLITAWKRFQLALLERDLRHGTEQYRAWRRSTTARIEQLERDLCNPLPGEAPQ